MNLKAVILFTSINFLFLTTTFSQGKNENNNFSDTSLYKFDTLINKVNIDNKLFSAEFLHTKNDELVFIIKNVKTGKSEYIKKFKENEYNIFKINHTSLNVK